MESTEKLLCDADDLRRLVNLWESAEAAERHFAPCQSALYRSFLKSVWSSEKMCHAAERVLAQLRALDEAAQAPSAGGEPAKKLREGEARETVDTTDNLKEESNGY